LLYLPASLAILLAGITGQAPAASASGMSPDSMPAAASGFGSALVGSAPVGTGPSELALDPATHTIYVANGNNANGPNAGGNTVSVIDARHCNAQDVSTCKGPWPTITVGNLPSTIAIDQRTDTVYVTDTGDNAVSVFNGATCNALVTSGCGQTPATVPVGLAPLGIYADPANHTVYIANSNNGAGSSTTVSMLDSATCNATGLAGCPAQPPPTVDVGADPDDVDVNQATHTVYVTTIGAQSAQNGWAVFSANTCNAAVQSGCGTIGRITGDPAGPNAGQVDAATDTLYTANYDNTISAFDLRHCDASDLAGCATDTPGTVTPFPQERFEHDLSVAVDAPLHSVYVVYQKDDSLIVVDTNICNGSHPAGCAALRPPAIHTGADPESVVLDSQTQTLYTANEVDNDVSVIDASGCNAHTTTGCRHPAPDVAISGPGALAADPAAHTTYVTSGSNTVSMIDTSVCNAGHPSGCATAPATVTVGDNPDAVAVDGPARTVYVANAGTGSSGTVSVINAATCNATDSAGCGTLATLHVPGGNPGGIAVNAATGTLYVATLTSSGPNLISVFNAATCNATNTTGCGQAPAVLSIGDSGGAQFGSALTLAIDPATNTVYATNVVTDTVPYGGDSVYVINGATCDAANTTGCGQTPATINAGFNPWGIAVDQATGTIYTANNADGEHPGTVSVINGATCNGTNHSGCGQAPATVAAGFGAIALTINAETGIIYVANIEDTSVSVINGATCNGSNTTGCGQTPAKVAVGNYPSALAADPAAGTVYLTNGDNTVSVIHG
jgi:DNA-binding beta-propeller fold protein YncE